MVMLVIFDDATVHVFTKVVYEAGGFDDEDLIVSNV
jgi:hypothetical protein